MQKDRKRFDRERTFGVEFEGYNINRYDLAEELTRAGILTRAESWNHETRPHWKVTTDGSLRGNDTFELVSPPLKGEEGLEEIRRVLAVVERLGGKINGSCGLHVHHDVSDWKAKQFKNLVALYARMEKTLDEAVPKSRRESYNNYCRSIRQKMQDPYQRERFDQVKTLEELRGWMGTRYMKLNIFSFWNYGTVEFRQHSGTFNADKVINWIIITQMMVQRSYRSVKLVIKDERYTRTSPWHLVAVDLSFEAIWRDCEEMVQQAIRYTADRIAHFRALEAA